MGIMATLGPTIRADETAKMIGWPTDNPFQFEVAMMNLSIGLLGLMCFWFHGNFWLATLSAKPQWAGAAPSDMSGT